MKKLIASAFTAGVMGASVMAAVPAANAAPYPGQFDTKCGAYAVGKPRAFATAKIRATVNAPGTTRSPKGWYNVTVEKMNGKDSSKKRYFTRGDAAIMEMGSLKPGRYIGSMNFDARPAARSPFQDCAKSFTFFIRRNK